VLQKCRIARSCRLIERAPPVWNKEKKDFSDDPRASTQIPAA